MSPALCVFLFSGPNSAAFPVVAVIGAAAGLYLFGKGFRLLRFKRMILDTPLSRIHSASVGLVEVTGTPVGPYALTAPVTGDPCYYYRVQAFQWVESDNKHRWKAVLDESLSIPFFLEDSTGRVLIVPESARMDVHRSFSDEIEASIFLTPGLCPPNVRDFLAKRGLVPEEKIKLEERIIPQNFPLFVFGTLGENPAPYPWAASPHKSSPINLSFHSVGGPSWSFSFRTNGQSNFSVRTPGPAVEATSSALGVPLESAPSQVLKGAATAVLPSRAAAIPPSTKPSAAKSAFGDFDLHPSVAISHGERNEPFAISGHSQREVVGRLAWQSAACIWGGPLLTLVCLYFLLNSVTWIP